MPDAQEAQHPREVAVAAEREHERRAIAQRGPSGGHDRQAAGEADADQPDAAVAREARLADSQTAASSIMSVVRGVMS